MSTGENPILCATCGKPIKTAGAHPSGGPIWVHVEEDKQCHPCYPGDAKRMELWHTRVIQVPGTAYVMVCQIIEEMRDRGWVIDALHAPNGYNNKHVIYYSFKRGEVATGVVDEFEKRISTRVGDYWKI